MQNRESGFFSSRKGILLVNYFFYATIILWVLGLSFKIQNWPGKDIMQILSMNCMAMLAMLLAFGSPQSNPFGFTNLLNHFALALLIVGYLFKIMHWPGNDMMIIISIIALALSAFIKSFLFVKRDTNIPKMVGNIVGYVFYIGFSIVILSSLFFIIQRPGDELMIVNGTGVLLVLIVIYAFVKSKYSINLISFSNRYTLIVIMFITSIWVYEDSKKMRLVAQELIYGLSIHDKIEMEVSRGDRILNSTSSNEMDKIKCMNVVNLESIEMIKNIEFIKMVLLEKSGEDTKRVEKGEFSCLVWSKYDEKKPLIPAELNYYGLIARNNYDVPMHTLGVRGYDGIERNGLGIKKLWAPYVAYQNRLIELCGSYSKNGENYSLKLNTETSISDEEVLLKTLNKSKINKADLFVLANLYSDLAFPEYDNPWMHFNESEGEPKLHWLTKNFDHTPMLKCLAILSDMELSIIKARTNAFAMISRR
jgi:hypothetical protein